MATVHGPLFSLDASGTVAKTAVYSKWKGRSYVRSHAVPANPQSDLQRSRRSLIQFLSRAWREMSDLQQSQWKELASRHNYSPFNAFTSYNANRYTQGLTPQITPTANNNLPATLEEESAAGGVGRVTYYYRCQAENKNDGWGIFVAVAPSLSLGWTQDQVKAGAVIVANNTLQRIDVLNMAPGTYQVAAYQFAEGGIVFSSSMLWTAHVT